MKIIPKAIVMLLSLYLIFPVSFAYATDAPLLQPEESQIEKELAKQGFDLYGGVSANIQMFDGDEIIIISETATPAKITEIYDDGIANDKEGKSYVQVEGNTFVEANRFSCDLGDIDKVKNFISENEFEQETIDDIIETAEVIQELGPSKATVTVYSSNKATTHTTYKGYQMKVESVSYSNIPTPTKTIYKGTNTKDKSKLMKNLLLSGVGFEERSMIAKKIPYISAALSVFDYFKNKYSENLVPSTTKDFNEINLSFDRTDKRVFVKDAGQWFHCLDAEYVKIRRLYVRICLFNKEKTKCYERTKETYPNSVFKTESYDSPYKNALKAHNSHFFNEYVTWKAGGKTFTFGV